MNGDHTETAESPADTTTQSTGPDGAAVLAATLDCFGIAAGSEYSLLLRDGRILCALPADRGTALKLLSLYQPQRPRAKALAAAFRICAGLGFHPRVLTRWRMPGQPAANSTPAAGLPGVLVGSTGHLCERAVVCLQSDHGWQICKVAFGENGHQILAHEANMLEALHEEFPNIPRLAGFTRNGDASLLRMPFQDGDSWGSSDLFPLIDLLNSWANRDQPKPLSSFPEWNAISPVLGALPEWRRHLGTLAGLELRPSVRHGDLTRPNLRAATGGRLLVHDWERGAMEGVPGLDAVHFLIQDRMFRKNTPPRQVVAETLSQLKTPPFSNLLKSSGWDRRECELMALTFAFNTGAGYIDQSTLIDCLESPGA